MTPSCMTAFEPTARPRPLDVTNSRSRNKRKAVALQVLVGLPAEDVDKILNRNAQILLGLEH